MPAALKNTFCDPVNLKANKIRILEVGEQAGSLCPLSYHELLQKKVLGCVTPALEPTDTQAKLSPPARGDHTGTLTEMGKRERQDRQTTSRTSARSKSLGDNLRGHSDIFL